MKKNIKSFIKRNLTITKLFAYVYNFGKYWRPPVTDINYLINQIFKSSDKVFFLQIGANDGVSGNSFLRQYILNNNWKGILVEPVPHNFKKLVINYESIPGLFFENVGIGSEVGVQPFYHFSESSSSWHNELGSFKKEILYKHNIANVDEIIITVEVPVLTISSLLKKHGLRNVDIITIDTEGYDFEILKTIDYKAHKPSIILYEHRHLSQTDYKQSIKLLSQNNYSLYSEYGSDTIAVLND